MQQGVKSHHRHFTVGVGSAVAEDLVRSLATKTGGACELVSPNENMAAAIVRHCKRSSLARVTAAAIQWPATPVDQRPVEIAGAFSGDTLHLFANFGEQPEGEANITIDFGAHRWQQQVLLKPYTAQDQERSLADMTLARLGAVRRILASEDEEEKIATALDYQLQSRLTNYLVIAEREIKDGSEVGPLLRTVPQMMKADCLSLPEGSCDSAPFDIPTFINMEAIEEQRYIQADRGGDSAGEEMDFDPSPSRRIANPHKQVLQARLSKEPVLRPIADSVITARLVSKLNEHFNRAITKPFPGYPNNLEKLVALGAEQRVINELASLELEGYDLEVLIAAWLYSLVQGEGDGLSHYARRAITKAYKKYCQGNELEGEILEVIAGMH